MKTHNLKIEPEYFEDILSGLKTFEIRKDDRGFGVEDELTLMEYYDGKYTGATLVVIVTYISSFEQKAGYVVMSITPKKMESND